MSLKNQNFFEIQQTEIWFLQILERLKNTQPKQKEEFELSGGGMNGHINEDPYRKRLNQRVSFHPLSAFHPLSGHEALTTKKKIIEVFFK